LKIIVLGVWIKIVGQSYSLNHILDNLIKIDNSLENKIIIFSNANDLEVKYMVH
jgi:hypothetical protein